MRVVVGRFSGLVRVLCMAGALALSCGACRHRPFEPRYQFGDPRSDAPPFSVSFVSMINLIATPDAYKDKRVSVHGFLCMETEDTALYIDDNYWRRGSTRDGISLNITNKLWIPVLRQLNGKYCSVLGQFGGSISATEIGRSTITNVECIEVFIR